MRLKITKGDQVAFNNLADATWFDVIHVDGYRLVIREAGTDYKEQATDTSLVKQVRKAK